MALLICNRYSYNNKQRRLRKSTKAHACKANSICARYRDRYKKDQWSTVNKKEKLREFGIKDEIVFLSVGELNKNKNQAIIIKALSRLDIPFKYILCGRGDKRKYLEQLSEQCGIRDKVIFAGYRSDINELLKCADIFCFPSYREGLSVALMEAMAAGLPCVVSKIRGNVDLIKYGVNGFLCDPNSTEEFADALAKLANDSRLRDRMKNANYRIIAGFDRVKVIDMMKTAYCFYRGNI